MDQISEIVVSFDSFSEPLIDQRLGEVIAFQDDTLHTVWSGTLFYDATKAARTVPPERRDRFEREVDIENTLRTRGITLFMTKTMMAVAGERLEPPKTVVETFPLRSGADPAPAR
jgi:hypothetical protein